MTAPARAPSRGVARRPAIDRPTAMRLAATEYDRVVAQLRGLDTADWARPTACPAWDVRAVAGHVLGMAEFAASPVEQVRQSIAARRRGGLFIDALTGLQVDKHAGRSPADIVERLASAGPRAARGRRRTVAPLRRIPMPGQPVDEAGQLTETWAVGFLVDVVLTRDTWMHRSDIALATGRPMTLTPDHDGVLVADVAREWAARHGQACSLTLTGPAGGSWTFGPTPPADAGPPYELDAVQFCRILSGRGTGHGLLTTRVPF